MTSFIITSKDKTKRREYIEKYCRQLTIDPLDITIIQKNTCLKQNTNTIGIEEVKNMQKKLFLKPIKSSTKAIILEDAHLLTTEAQNALLKILEEPPDNTIIVLSSESKEQLLPTIISRCKITDIKNTKDNLPAQEIKELIKFTENLEKMSVSEKFKKAEIMSKDKEKSLVWIENIILVLREQILKQAADNKTHINSSLYNLKLLQKTHTLLKTTNINPRLLLENTLIFYSPSPDNQLHN